MSGAFYMSAKEGVGALLSVSTFKVETYKPEFCQLTVPVVLLNIQKIQKNCPPLHVHMHAKHKEQSYSS